jgi:hypothetical protein
MQSEKSRQIKPDETLYNAVSLYIFTYAWWWVETQLSAQYLWARIRYRVITSAECKCEQPSVARKCKHFVCVHPVQGEKGLYLIILGINLV